MNWTWPKQQWCNPLPPVATPVVPFVPPKFHITRDGRVNEWYKTVLDEAPDPKVDFLDFEAFARKKLDWGRPGELVEIFPYGEHRAVLSFRVGGQIRWKVTTGDDPVVTFVTFVTVPESLSILLVARIAGAMAGERVKVTDTGTGVARTFKVRL